MMPVINKELIDDVQSKCEGFLFVNNDPKILMEQMGQLVFLSDLLLDYPELNREAGFLDNLINAYETKIRRLDPNAVFEFLT